MAAYSELVIEQNATFKTTVNVEDAYGNVVDLNGYSAASMMRKSYYSTTSYIITATVTNLITGEITLSMTAANTALLSPGRYAYDLIINDGANTITRVVEGVATVLPAVTK